VTTYGHGYYIPMRSFAYIHVPKVHESSRRFTTLPISSFAEYLHKSSPAYLHTFTQDRGFTHIHASSRRSMVSTSKFAIVRGIVRGGSQGDMQILIIGSHQFPFILTRFTCFAAENLERKWSRHSVRSFLFDVIHTCAPNPTSVVQLSGQKQAAYAGDTHTRLACVAREYVRVGCPLCARYRRTDCSLVR
jgi:hypothetical protein